MTSPPTSPNRRRRRIVVTIAVLILALGWWGWPRGDARFVGKWRAPSPHSQSAPRFSLQLWSNGSGAMYSPSGRPSYYLRWSSDRDTFSLHGLSLPSLISKPIVGIVEQLTGAWILTTTLVYRLDSVAPEEFVISEPGIRPFTYQRVPE